MNSALIQGALLTILQNFLEYRSDYSKYQLKFSYTILLLLLSFKFETLYGKEGKGSNNNGSFPNGKYQKVKNKKAGN